MQQIIITVRNLDVVAERKNSVLVMPEFKIDVPGGISRDDLAGMLLSAYLRSADMFVEHHQAACINCPAYRLHNAGRFHLRNISKEIFEGKTG